MCREYGCWRLLILDRDGKPVGRITGPRILRTKDKSLKEIWERRITPLDPSDQKLWDTLVEKILLEEDYSIRH